MNRHRKGFIRTAFMFLLASVALFLLISLLHRHFNTHLTTGESSRSAPSSPTGLSWHQEPYVLTDEARPKVTTSKDKQVQIGMEIENIYNLSLKDRVFMVEGWYWLKWPEAVNTIIRENQIDQTKIIEMTNQVESDSLLIEVEQPNPERLNNGDYWQTFHFSGKFYIDTLDLSGFPFDDLQLPISMEMGPNSLSCYPGNRYGCIALVFDKAEQGHSLGQYVGINGYSIFGTESREYLHQYTTSFGRGEPNANSAVQMNILYRANFTAAFWNYIFPLLVLIGIAIMSPSLPGSLGDVRLAIPTTILLTLIFLQIGYRADLPPLDYVSYLDWLYIYAYAVSAALFILFCWGTNAHTNACSQGNEQSIIRRIERVDTVVQWVASAGLVLVIASGLLFQA